MPKNLAKTYRASRHNGIMVEGEGETDLEMANHTSLHNHNAVSVHTIQWYALNPAFYVPFPSLII